MRRCENSTGEGKFLATGLAAAGVTDCLYKEAIAAGDQENSEFDASAEASGRNDFGHSEFSKT
jgi:hypothetical protein